MRHPHTRSAFFLPMVAGLTMLAGAALSAPPAAATTLTVRYGASLMGVPVGKVKASLSVDKRSYHAEGYAKATGFSRLFSDARVNAEATGTLTDAPEAQSYHRHWVEDGEAEDLSLSFANGRVSDLRFKADKPPKEYADRVPLRPEHKTGVIDPLSALVMPIAGRRGKDLCEERTPVFENNKRFDITMRFARTERYNGGSKSYSGPVVVCAVRYVPIAGHRAHKKSERFMAANKDMEVWLAPIETVGLAIPVKMRVRTELGVLTATADRLNVR
ncbi:DUF3108 domain-containing protein [Afifella sp. H1R]|uniref:DUF3108 domain-containing protein n=1 Tax=Afifella sp. H1R TaxID=2908841 RepID=UPI001F32290D|nr:DUF3108 domain-containing protein [Afifella sp. H1R]MCF1504266.1 DUF3108 domain-containing protein [Afifella sp. H1R]